jgi:SHS2 domain-containing protein
MVDLLTDMLVLFETDGMLVSEVEADVAPVEGHWRAVANVRGETYDGERHELLHDIKAVTYHTLEVRPDEGWARVLFDI